MNDGTIHTDLSGRFPTRSYRNMQYIFVAYAYQPNAIILEPMKSRESTSMVEAFQSVYEYLKKCGHKPKLNVIDNECSKAVKEYLQKKKPGSNSLKLTTIVSMHPKEQYRPSKTMFSPA